MDNTAHHHEAQHQHETQLFLEQPVATSNVDNSMKDILYGSIAGACGKVIEYPFDTVKVRLQSQKDTAPLQFKGPIDCLRKSIKQEGILGLYRGVASPIVGAAAETASLFVTYNIAQRFLGDQSMGSALICGSFSGAITSFILTPIELIKCKMQVQGIDKDPKKGILHLTRDIYKRYGILGFWKGQTGTLLRETGGSAAWFGAYEYVSKALSKDNSDGPAPWQSMVAGASAGIAYNVSLFPADTIKSRIQTQHGVAELGFWATGQSIVRHGGVQALYRGCGITVCRSAPSSAIIFLTYETLKKLF